MEEAPRYKLLTLLTLLTLLKWRTLSTRFTLSDSWINRIVISSHR